MKLKQSASFDQPFATIDHGSIVSNMVDRHRDGLYDRVRLASGVMVPERIDCFQAGIGPLKGWLDTNMTGHGQLNPPMEAIVQRFMVIFQPGGSLRDQLTLLKTRNWEFWVLQKIIQRHPLLEFSVRGNVADVIQNFGSEECKGSLQRFAVPYAYNLGDLARYIPPLVQFKVSLPGESFVPQSDMDFYVILDGTTHGPVL